MSDNGTRVIAIPDGVTTRQVNDAIRKAIRDTLAMDHFRHMRDDVTGDHRRDRFRRFVAPGVKSDVVTVSHVFGFHSDFRSTWIATYSPTTREVRVAKFVNYPGWSRACPWDRARVVMLDHVRANLATLTAV